MGKSSFINRFLGEERLLVSDHPGTTRDAIDISLTYDGQDYVLVDTAGLRRPSQVGRQGLERQMVLKSIKALSRAEVAVLLLDAREGLTGQDLRIAGLIEDQGKGCLILVNKWDLVPKDPQVRQEILDRIGAGLEFMAYVPVLPVSVKTGYNLTQGLSPHQRDPRPERQAPGHPGTERSCSKSLPTGCRRPATGGGR